MKNDDEETTVPTTPNNPDTMLIARPLKPRRLSIATTASGSFSCSLDADGGWATPQTSVGLEEVALTEDRQDRDLRELRDLRVDPLRGNRALGTPTAGHAPVSPFYETWPGPPKTMPPSPGYMQRPPLLSSGPPTPHTGDASQRRGFAEEEDILTGTALKLLAMLLSGPAIPALPPCGCYGGLLVSSAISEGLGLQAAEAAKAAAEGHGDKPVKVLLPRYPDLPGLVGDHTKPAKLPDPDAPVPSAPPTPGPWPPTPPGPPLVLPPPGAAMPPPVVPR
ncbi:unnamed protein product [Durusdinium trenchii]|uniref:Uncharacterized protein n=2 Tax=Durusdinium trenchii TaxID=1381693 RepID=A0ABP0I1X5_9DINO